MDFASVLSKSNPHQRTIIHLDMDYYYAQVEEIRDPTLRTQPLGVQQKNCVVTCNYIARDFGVKKLMSVDEAKRLCPDIVLVNGEDLTPYRQMSQRIFDLLLNFTPLIEKLGMDENFMDVTELVQKRAKQQQEQITTCQDDDEAMGISQVEGNIYPVDGATLNACECGCAQRLAIGTIIAMEIRNELRSKLGITCCAGISYNKLLAKLVGAQNKPNQQTVLVSSHTEQFMCELKDLHRVTGIGQKTESLLLESGIANIAELQQCEIDCLRKKFGFETAIKLKDLSFGRDMSAVRPSGKPKTIGLEDSCRPISVRTDVEDRFRLLLMRLIEQVSEDGRIPITIKVILRKFDAQKKTSHRETKQSNILPSLFKSTSCTDTGGAKVMLADGAQEKLLKIIMRLFERVVDLSKPFNITLIGLAFSKFQQRKMGPSSIANFLIKKTDLEVQSITSLTNVPSNDCCPVASVSATHNDEAFRSSPTTFQPSDQFYRRRTTAASPIPMLLDNGSESGATNSDFSDFSETEVEPSPKKSRIGRILMTKRRCLSGNAVCTSDAADVASPSKLRVCDLRLNSRDSEKEFPSSNCAAVQATSSSGGKSSATMQKFRTIQSPLALVNRIDGCRPTTISIRQNSATSSSNTSSPLPSPMDDSSVTPTELAPSTLPIADIAVVSADVSNAFTTVTTVTTITSNVSNNIPCPAGVDPQVFNELPLEVQHELIESWRKSLAAAAAAVANSNNVPATPSVSSTSRQVSNSSTATKAGGSTANGTQKNTLYRYFLRNK